MSDFWKKKIRKYFTTFDFDSDGVISKNDFLRIADRYIEFRKIDEQKTERLKTHFQEVWELFVQNAGIGSTNTLTVDDLIISIGKQRYGPQMIKSYGGLLRGLHDLLDVNQDGFLQEEEFARLFFQLGVEDASVAKEAFNAFDTNGDGILSVDELNNAFFDFFFSDDEKSPNAMFFGPLDD